MDLKAEIHHGIKSQELSLAGEPLVEILENVFGNTLEYWLESIPFIPQERIKDIRDFAARASQCPGWHDSQFYSFYPSISSLMYIGGFAESKSIEIYSSYLDLYSDKEYKTGVYLEIIEHYVTRRSDKHLAILWLKKALEDLEELDWFDAKIQPSDIFPNYSMDNIYTLSDLGHALFSDGNIAEALALWSSISTKNPEAVKESILHAIFEYASEYLQGDLEYLIDGYELSRTRNKISDT